MSDDLEGPSGFASWLGFLVVFALMVYCWPELLGMGLGILRYMVPAYIFYRLFGGKGPFVG